MSGNLSGLPPSAIARLNAVADIQAIAVKLIELPDGLKNNPSPIKITGTVMGQSPDGSVQVSTDKGVINLMLKDRQPLPQGLKLEIEIPAGRNPQQAAIRNAPESAAPVPSTSSAPSLAATLAQTPLSSAAAAASLKLDRTSALKATEIEDALRAASPRLADMVASLKAQTVPLQAGQNMRLLPLPPQQGQQAAAPVQAMTQQALLAALTGMIEQLPAEQQALKAQLVTLLSRMNLSSLEVPSQNGKAPPSLPQNIQQLLQLPETIGKNGKPQPLSLQIRYEPTQIINPSKPVDVQVAAFLTTALKPPAVPGQAAPVLPGQLQIQLPASGQQSAAPVVPLPVQSGTATPVQAPAIPLPAQILPAQVTGFTKENLPIVSLPNPGGGTPISYVAQFPASNLQVGSPLLVSVLPTTTPLQIPGTVAQPLPLATWMQPGIWDSMTDLLQSIHQINPGIAHHLSQIIPQPSQPHNMGPLAMFFLSVLRSGDMESWVSPQVANLLRLTGKGEVLRAVASDIALTGRSENLTLPQDWRATMFPVYHDQNIHKVPLYYKHQHEEAGDDHKVRRSKLMRFLFDLKLARMGNVQIDGFMQPERLDMIMRTKSPLSVQMQRNMQGLYTKAMDKSNLHGELTFQFKPEHWVTIDIPVTADEMGVTA